VAFDITAYVAIYAALACRLELPLITAGTLLVQKLAAIGLTILSLREF
jgi:predicted nucleic acid-binding protein